VDTIATSATQAGVVSVVVNDAKSGQSDNVERVVPVKQAGFPIVTDFGGLLKHGTAVQHTLVLDDNVIAGSANVSAVVYVTPVGSLMAALEALIQDPCGCFEQTSSTTYPLIMAQTYFKVANVFNSAGG
jgi:alpha-2-macroglobulin-like protein